MEEEEEEKRNKMVVKWRREGILDILLSFLVFFF